MLQKKDISQSLGVKKNAWTLYVVQFNKESMQLLLLHDQEITFCVPTVVAQIIPLKTVGFFMDILKVGMTPHQEEVVAVEVAEVAVEAGALHQLVQTTLRVVDYQHLDLMFGIYFLLLLCYQ